MFVLFLATKVLVIVTAVKENEYSYCATFVAARLSHCHFLSMCNLPLLILISIAPYLGTLPTVFVSIYNFSLVGGQMNVTQ